MTEEISLCCALVEIEFANKQRVYISTKISRKTKHSREAHYANLKQPLATNYGVELETQLTPTNSSQLLAS